MTTKEMIKVMQAYADGKSIERRRYTAIVTEWEKDDSPIWDWSYYAYRIKPSLMLKLMPKLRNGMFVELDFGEKILGVVIGNGVVEQNGDYFGLGDDEVTNRIVAKVWAGPLSFGDCKYSKPIWEKEGQ